MNVGIGRDLVGRRGLCEPESSKSRAFPRLPWNARIVTTLALVADEESR